MRVAARRALAPTPARLRARVRAASLAALAALACGLPAGAAAWPSPGSHGPARSETGPCAGLAPRRLQLRRIGITVHARLSWSTPAGLRGNASAAAAVVYRVLRSGRTVGQTHGRSLVLAVRPGRRATFTVQARYAQAPAVCTASTMQTVAVIRPGRVTGLKVTRRTAHGVVLGWRGAPHGEAPIVGYRVFLDGAVAGQTHGRSYTLIFNAGRVHRVSVAAVDSRGRLGTPSGELLIAPLGADATSGFGPATRSASGGAHGSAGAGGGAVVTPPAAPEGVSAEEVGETEATIVWVAGAQGSRPLAGYRVYRDGEVVGQTSQTSLRLTHLDSARTYSITVAAVDVGGVQGQQSAPLSLTTTHQPPSAPAQLSAVRVTDTSATLTWQPGSAVNGAVEGYLVFEDGEPVGVVEGDQVTVTLASERTYTFAVRTLDTAGYLSAPSEEVTVVTTHTPPPSPGGVSVASVTSSSARITWEPSTAVSGTIVGYRVFRGEVIVGQVSGTEATVEGLQPASEYTITVTAVDSLGAVSQPSAPLTVHTADPPPTHGSVQGYLLASTDESFEDLEAHYQQIGVIYPTYYECGPQGQIEGSNDPLFTDWALLRKVEVLPRFNCLDVPAEERILSQTSVREATIEALAQLCRTYGYSGIQIDFEDAPPQYREPFTAFIAALAAKLHAQGDKLSTVVTAKYWNVPTGRAAMYNDAALSQYSDYVFLLDWGIHWVTSSPGSIDELGWFTRVAEYTATMPNRSKFVLGMPLYGVDWPEGGGPMHSGTALEYSAVMALADQLGITPEWEEQAASPHFSYTTAQGVHHQVWFVDRQSLAIRAALAERLGMKVGLWRLGQEDQTVWELPQLGGEG